jgi:hypothetical protein
MLMTLACFVAACRWAWALGDDSDRGGSQRAEPAEPSQGREPAPPVVLTARAWTGLGWSGSGLPDAYGKDCPNPANLCATVRLVPFGMLISNAFLIRATRGAIGGAKLPQVKARRYDRRYHNAVSGFHLAVVGRLVSHSFAVSSIVDDLLTPRS